MSQMVIHESSNFEDTSSDNQLSDWGADNMHYADQMIQSRNKVDNRLIDLYKIRKASQQGLHLGFKNPAAEYKQFKI